MLRQKRHYLTLRDIDLFGWWIWLELSHDRLRFLDLRWLLGMFFDFCWHNVLIAIKAHLHILKAIKRLVIRLLQLLGHLELLLCKRLVPLLNWPIVLADRMVVLYLLLTSSRLAFLHLGVLDVLLTYAHELVQFLLLQLFLSIVFTYWLSLGDSLCLD